LLFHSFDSIPEALLRTCQFQRNRGVTTHAPSQVLAYPQKNAFGTPDAGVLQALSFDQNASFVRDIMVSFPTSANPSQTMILGKLDLRRFSQATEGARPLAGAVR
jgi:hypothetical protein